MKSPYWRRVTGSVLTAHLLKSVGNLRNRTQKSLMNKPAHLFNKSEDYCKGYYEGLNKGERITRPDEQYINAFNSIYRMLLDEGYIFPNGEESSKGLHNPDMMKVWAVVKGILALDDELVCAENDR